MASNQSTATGRPRWRRRIGWSLVGVLLFALGAVAMTGVMLYLRAEASVDRVEVDTLTDPGDLDGDGVADYEEIPGAINVLVVGSDARDGLTPEERAELGTGDDDGGMRTDTMMVARLDPETDEVSLLSFPRDLRVELCDGSTDKINAAYQVGENTGRGGPSCLVETIRDVSGISIQHFVAIDFAGFIEVVDVVGGVDVYLEHPIDDWRANLDLDAGCQRLDGVEALGFARHRASDSDYGRIARQQRLIKELVRETASIGTLANVPRLFELVETGAGAVEADESLSLDRMRRIAFSLRDLGGDSVQARTVPADFEMIDDIAYEILREDEAADLFYDFRTGALEDPREPEDSEEPRIAASDVPPVTVLNAAGEPGLAAAISDELGERGFTVASVGNAQVFGAHETEVRYSPELADEAAFLGAHLPSAELSTRTPQGDGIEIVLGEIADPALVSTPEEFGGGDDGGGPADGGNGEADGGNGEADGGEGGEGDPLEEGRGQGESAPEPDEFYVGAQSVPDDCRR
ncbi:LytR family transcriptional regulator [Egibacter rhizosphaerae]|uniref:LytR family transcriptional regulator n=1 Tax=Egibacter rhizosphaerae TaxID=1670831 RepID=A0A411YHI1_9ACTN|nr:LCP family protein [Egibacter rhizosphaerae]QBI20683.1 LytR family transcriptional regulator [Egibacter rhizosphaerae]